MTQDIFARQSPRLAAALALLLAACLEPRAGRVAEPTQTDVMSADGATAPDGELVEPPRDPCEGQSGLWVTDVLDEIESGYPSIALVDNQRVAEIPFFLYRRCRCDDRLVMSPPRTSSSTTMRSRDPRP